MVLNCYRFLNFQTETEVLNLTLREYFMRMEAYALQQVDEMYKVHVQAWATQQAKAQKKKGKNVVSVYDNFNDFFDYEKALDQFWGVDKELKQPTKKDSKIIHLLEKANKKGGK